MNGMDNKDNATAKHTQMIAYSLGFITFVLMVYILMALKKILIPITIAIFLTFLFSPLVDYLKKHKVPKWVSLVLILIFVSGIYYLMGLLVVANFDNFTEKLQIYSANLAHFLQNMLSPFNLTVHELGQMLNIRTEEFNVNSIFQSLFKAGIIQNIFNSFSSMLGDFFITMVFWMFMIMGKSKFEERLKSAFYHTKINVEKYLTAINVQLQSYIMIKTITSFVTGTIVTLILWAFGIDFALFWGILTFVLNYIPNIGSLIATVFPIVISFLEYGLGVKTVSLSLLLILNQNLIGSFIEPHYMGRQMDLSPVFVLFSLIFWGWIWGIVGMFLSVPIAATMKIMFSNIEPLKPLAVIMGSKPAPMSD